MNETEFLEKVSANFKKMIEELEANYKPLEVFHLNEEKEKMLGNAEATRTCRFCGRSLPEVTFDKVAHAVPHFIGNRVLKSLYECDDCNGNVFSPMESHFSHFMSIYHTLYHVSKGGKVPTFKCNSSEKSKIVVEGKDIKIDCVEGENLTAELDKENKRVIIHAKRSYVPQLVYKIFIKMALSIMPEEEMPHFKKTLEWLLGKRQCTSDLKLIERRYERLYNPFEFVSCMLFKRKDDARDKVPAYLFGLAYNNFFFQTYIPLCDEDKDLAGEVHIPFIPTPLDEKYESKVHIYDLGSMEKVYQEEVSQSFTYGSMEETLFDQNAESPQAPDEGM